MSVNIIIIIIESNEWHKSIRHIRQQAYEIHSVNCELWIEWSEIDRVSATQINHIVSMCQTWLIIYIIDVFPFGLWVLGTQNRQSIQIDR